MRSMHERQKYCRFGNGDGGPAKRDSDQGDLSRYTDQLARLPSGLEVRSGALQRNSSQQPTSLMFAVQPERPRDSSMLLPTNLSPSLHHHC